MHRSGTRAKKTVELKELVATGPSLSLEIFGVAGKPALTKAQAEEIARDIRLWLSTWVEPLCSDLIKEWKGKK